MIKEITDLGLSNKKAFKILLSSLFKLDIIDSPEDKIFYYEYFDEMINELNINDYNKIFISKI